MIVGEKLNKLYLHSTRVSIIRVCRNRNASGAIRKSDVNNYTAYGHLPTALLRFAYFLAAYHRHRLSTCLQFVIVIGILFVYRYLWSIESTFIRFVCLLRTKIAYCLNVEDESITSYK